MQNSFFGATNSVQHWYESTSDNQVSVSGSVFGYYDSSYAPTACSNTGDVLGRFLAEAATDAARDGYKSADYDHLVVYTPRISMCGFSGTAWVGANGVLLNGTSSASTAEHELGHNLGLWHAGSCASANVTSSCVSDYGDVTDVMGASTANHGFNAEHKRMIGWLPQSEVATVTAGTHTIALTSSTHPLQPGTTEEIVIPRGDGTSYFVERRTSEGYDNGLDNVYVRLITRVNTDDTIIFDPVPSSPSAGLGSGETYVDTAKHITIATLSNNAGDPTASVKVCIGTCGSTPPTTTTSVPPITDAVTVSVAKGRVHVIGTSGNDVVHLTTKNSRRYVDATGAPVTAGAGCKVDPTATIPTVMCREAVWSAALGAGDDKVIVSGRTRSFLDGGPGNDTFVGGTGADTLCRWRRLRHGRLPRPPRHERRDRRGTALGREGRARRDRQRHRAGAAAVLSGARRRGGRSPASLQPDVFSWRFSWSRSC